MYKIKKITLFFVKDKKKANFHFVRILFVFPKKRLHALRQLYKAVHQQNAQGNVRVRVPLINHDTPN